MKDHMDQVRLVNEAAFWYTTRAGDTVSRVFEAPAVGFSVKSGSSETSKEREANERLVVLISLLFMHQVLGSDGKL